MNQMPESDKRFYIEELFCNFCDKFDIYKSETHISCVKCIGLIYALKRKVYFVVN